MPGDHLISDFEPSVPTLPSETPGVRRRSPLPSSSPSPSNVEHGQRGEAPRGSGAVSPSNPQVSTSTPVSLQGSPAQPNHYHRYRSPANSIQAESLRGAHAAPTIAEPVDMASISGITAMLAPHKSPTPDLRHGTTGSDQLPVATVSSAAPSPGALGGVNFFRKSRVRKSESSEPSLIQTLVHGGANAALAIGRATGVLSPENRALLANETKRGLHGIHKQPNTNKRRGALQGKSSGNRLRYTSSSYARSSRRSHMSASRD